MPEHRLTEPLDILEACIGDAAPAPPEERAALLSERRAAVVELRTALAPRRWPWVVRGGLPPGPVPHWLGRRTEQP